jgi:hypothetical protein
MRSFPFRYQRRLLKIGAVLSASEWELWVYEGDQRLTYGSRLSAVEEIEGWRCGQDRLWIVAEEVKSNILTGRLPVPPLPEANAYDSPTVVGPQTTAKTEEAGLRLGTVDAPGNCLN